MSHIITGIDIGSAEIKGLVVEEKKMGYSPCLPRLNTPRQVSGAA